MKKDIENWEKKFDEMFSFYGDDWEIIEVRRGFGIKEAKKEWEKRSRHRLEMIKGFIRELLKQEKQKWQEEWAEKMMEYLRVLFEVPPIEVFLFVELLQRKLKSQKE